MQHVAVRAIQRPAQAVGRQQQRGQVLGQARATRLARYTANMRALYDGVAGLGLSPYLPPALQGPIVVNMHAPDAPTWNLQLFVDALKQRGFVLSNFTNTELPTFRVGCIGAFGPDQMRLAVDANPRAGFVGARPAGPRDASSCSPSPSSS
ncbi:hypothetical protein [Lactiplantibacillus plantarum]|uniref:hypothetical protein n=1 Tax=Lactiplantibacillus plantarum TaxID=1590 RepID=UPI0040468878